MLEPRQNYGAYMFDAIKTVLRLVGVLLIVIVIGAIFDINIYPFGGSNKKTERTYLLELKQTGTVQELSDKLALQFAEQGKWADDKTAVANFSADIKVCFNKAITNHLNSDASSLNAKATVPGVRALAGKMAVHCIDKIIEDGEKKMVN